MTAGRSCRIQIRPWLIFNRASKLVRTKRSQWTEEIRVASKRKADQSLFADNQLGSGTVVPGDKSRDFIAFDVAPGAVTVMISGPLMQEAARIKDPVRD